MTSVDIIIPVLNEEATLARNVGVALDYIATLPAPWNDAALVIVDNGSTDRTEAIGRELQAGGRVRYVRLDQRGVGRALKAGWTSSGAEYVGYMDLDLATDLKHLPEAFAALAGGADVVYGTRLHRESVVKGRTVKREVISRIFNGILRAYLGARFSDGMCGFKFLRRSILPNLMANGAESDGWFFATELLFVAQRLGYRLHELPVRWTDDPDSRVKVMKLSLEYLAAMRRLRGRSYPAPAR
jgi:glycosyltransferase involved in cell wall biosynthesis